MWRRLRLCDEQERGVATKSAGASLNSEQDEDDGKGWLLNASDQLDRLVGPRGLLIRGDGGSPYHGRRRR